MSKETWLSTTLPRKANNSSLLGTRSKSQDTIRRKTVRFEAEAEDERPKSSFGLRPSSSNKGRNFFLLSMLQGGDPSSSSGRAKSSKVTAFSFSVISHCVCMVGKWASNLSLSEPKIPFQSERYGDAVR